MERNKIWEELYCSEEMRQAAQYLISNSTFLKHSPELHEDLLSDALIRVFEKREDYAELHAAGRLKGYVFQAMYGMTMTRTARENGDAWARMDKWAQMFGCAEYNESTAQAHAVRTLEQTKNSSRIGPTSGNRTFVEAIYASVGLEESQSAPLEVTEDEAEYVVKLFKEANDSAVRLMRKIDEADAAKETNFELWESAQYTKLLLEFRSVSEISRATGVKRRQVRNYLMRFKQSLEGSRMKVSVVTFGQQPAQGMELYRLFYPYFDGIATYHKDEFEVKHVTYDYIAQQPSGGLESDVYVFSRVQPHCRPLADKVFAEGKKVVMDIDDYWNVNADHPLRYDENNHRYASNITDLLPKCHMVTTTSYILAERLDQELGVKAVVIKNTIPETAEQFQGDKYQSSLVRFGWIGGVHHKHDLMQMYDGLKKIYSNPGLTGKYQICLGGYNVNPHFVAYEKILTCDGYLTRADQDYIDYLECNTPALDHIAYHKPYRRMWAQPVHTYGQMYRQTDVALVPLMGKNLFASCKSELKLVEAGMTKTALIASDELPYSPHLQHEKNCLKITRGDWATNIRRMMLDQDLREETADNLHKYVKKHFNHRVETNKLATALKRLA